MAGIGTKERTREGVKTAGEQGRKGERGITGGGEKRLTGEETAGRGGNGERKGRGILPP